MDSNASSSLSENHNLTNQTDNQQPLQSTDKILSGINQCITYSNTLLKHALDVEQEINMFYDRVSSPEWIDSIKAQSVSSDSKVIKNGNDEMDMEKESLKDDLLVTPLEINNPDFQPSKNNLLSSNQTEFSIKGYVNPRPQSLESFLSSLPTPEQLNKSTNSESSSKSYQFSSINGPSSSSSSSTLYQLQQQQQQQEQQQQQQQFSAPLCTPYLPEKAGNITNTSFTSTSSIPSSFLSSSSAVSSPFSDQEIPNNNTIQQYSSQMAIYNNNTYNNNNQSLYPSSFSSPSLQIQQQQQQQQQRAIINQQINNQQQITKSLEPSPQSISSLSLQKTLLPPYQLQKNQTSQQPNSTIPISISFGTNPFSISPPMHNSNNTNTTNNNNQSTLHSNTSSSSSSSTTQHPYHSKLQRPKYSLFKKS